MVTLVANYQKDYGNVMDAHSGPTYTRTPDELAIWNDIVKPGVPTFLLFIYSMPLIGSDKVLEWIPFWIVGIPFLIFCFITSRGGQHYKAMTVIGLPVFIMLFLQA